MKAHKNVILSAAAAVGFVAAAGADRRVEGRPPVDAVARDRRPPKIRLIVASAGDRGCGRETEGEDGKA